MLLREIIALNAESHKKYKKKMNCMGKIWGLLQFKNIYDYYYDLNG
jgi:hypothetical protein